MGVRHLADQPAQSSALQPAALPGDSGGLFISFEGIDGAGKSTHITALADAFRQAGRAVTLTREPGGTALAEKLRQVVLNDAMDPLTESLLIFAARRDHVVNVIAPALARGDVLLCDRFTDASFAYQGGGRGFDLAVLSTLEAWVQACDDDAELPTQKLLQPHLTIWFDLPPEEAALRLADARMPDKFEAQPLAFFRRVAAGYAARLQREPHRFARIDASQAPDAVGRDIRQVLLARGWL
ncbi:MAG: thymidylate kinase [Polaromonas sp.]|nr:thymidylate kinase [Polaromonas sp.]